MLPPVQLHLLHRASLRHRPLYQCRHTYATLLLSAGEDMRFVASQMGHTNLAMIIRHYARWTRRTPAGDNAINKVLEASGLSKMPELCQKVAGATSIGSSGRTGKKLDLSSRLRKKSPQPAPSLLSPPGQGEKMEEGSHLLCRVLLPSGNQSVSAPVFPHPARNLLERVIGFEPTTLCLASTRSTN